MKKAITITKAESENISRLFYKYNAYMNMLEYLAARITDSAIYEKKWEEAVNIWIELDRAKVAVEKKYKPAGDWDRYEFNFDDSQVVFIKNENS